MNGQFIENDLYEIIFSRDGDYVMQDITGIEDHQYQTITSDKKSNTCTLPSFIFFPWSVAVFFSLLTSDQKLFLHLGRLTGVLAINIFHLYSYSIFFR